MKRIAWAMLAFAALAGLVPGTAEAQSGCPDTRASQVDAKVSTAGTTAKCGIGLKILGVRLGFYGPTCPEFKFTYPSHQECKGEANPGTSCLVTGQLDVTKESCKCVFIGLGSLGTGVMTPACECTASGTAGHIEDSQTMTCPLPPEPFD